MCVYGTCGEEHVGSPGVGVHVVMKCLMCILGTEPGASGGTVSSQNN